METFIQLRSLRKNFSTFLFSKTRTEFDTDMNKKKIFGHEAKGATSGYYERLEPSISCEIINAINFQEKIDFTEIKNIVNEVYVEIATELPWVIEVKEEWRIKGKIKSKKGRRV